MQVPWGHHIVIMNKCGGDVEKALFYVRKTVENVLTIPDTHTILKPSLGVIPLQIFSYYMALQRGATWLRVHDVAEARRTVEIFSSFPA